MILALCIVLSMLFGSSSPCGYATATYRTTLQDVHAGNLLVLEDGRVAFIDFGIVGRFSPDTWSGVSRLADGVSQEDFTVMAEVR